MAGNIIVGFAPVAAGNAGKGNAGFSSAAEAAEGPPGLFGALLGAANVEEPAAVEFAAAGQLALETVTTGLVEPASPLDVEFGLEAPEVDGEALLGELVEALATLDQALANGEPAAPVLIERIDAALEALAGLLGIPLPADPRIDPTGEAVDGAGSVLPTVPAEIIPLLDLAGEALPAPGSASSLAAVAAPAAPAAPTISFAAPRSVELPEVPLPAGIALPAGDGVGTPVTASALPSAEAVTAGATVTEPAIDPNSTLGQLVGKITELAQALEPQSPGLAKRLAALVEKLSSGQISAQMLAELGIDTEVSLSEDDLDRALQKLLGASSEIKGTPAPQAFAAAQLRLPEVIALPPKALATSAPDLPPVSPPAVPKADTEAPADATPRLALEPQPTETPDKAEPQPAARGSVAEAPRPAAARSEAAIEPGPAAPPAVPAVVGAAVVAGTKAIHAAYQAPVQQISIPQVAFEVVRQVQAGSSRFQIRLDPPELGRIDVKLDVDQSGNVNARMTVERAETLDLMQRDQRALERALAQAGLDSAKTSLEFSLRQNPFAREDGGDGRGKGSPFGGGGERAELGEDTPETAQTLYRGSTSASGVNLFV